MIFIDFQKAFNKVMQEALFEKMDAIGIRGKFLNLIKSIYATSRACVRVNGRDSDEVYEMTRGTRQGCPLSPTAFAIFVNDFLRYVPDRVNIPGLKKGHCPALLFADNIVGLTTSEEEVHTFLDGVTAFSREWKLPIGVVKCGVMMIGGSEDEQLELSKKVFKVDNQTVEVCQKYKYLGIWVTDKLGDKEQTDELAHCRTLAKKVKTAVDMRRGFLRDKSYPLDIKLAVINSKIIPVGTYGGEWVGLCQKRTDIIQRAVNVALRLILQSSTKSNLHGVKTMAWELGVPTVEERMADLRVRLYQKASTLKTWLKDQVSIDNRFKDRSRVWSLQTSHSLTAIKKTG
jgi:hypothetical protein